MEFSICWLIPQHKVGPQIKQDQCLIWAYKSAWLAGASSSNILSNLRTHFMENNHKFFLVFKMHFGPL